eukprot:TRINITY_DN5120_c2_g1_i1.p1 TRINITY_DN5120_c2_g1~~TRINITY_DN5120_c2_g1_i1.p1  ORF type:complete len:532 (+),score=87.10 TRINITY_DN5120_c2_g1_i1:129-1724(+)
MGCKPYNYRQEDHPVSAAPADTRETQSCSSVGGSFARASKTSDSQANSGLVGLSGITTGLTSGTALGRHHCRTGSWVQVRRQGARDTRFRSLLLERLLPGADVGSIDQRLRSQCEGDWVVCILKGHWVVHPATRYDSLAAMLLLRKACRPVFARYGGRLLKWNDSRAFLVFRTESGAVRCALACAAVSRQVARTFPQHALVLSGGISAGRLLLFDDVGDFYGDPVNTASKLGEDYAQSGEVFLAARSFTETISGCRCQPREAISISGLEIPCSLCCIEAGSAFEQEVLRLAGEWQGGREAALRRARAEERELVSVIEEDALSILDEGHGDPPVKRYECETAILCTDMSGFSRLTKKYGILHYLTLIMKQREVWDAVLPRYGGWVVKYDGDDVVAVFADPIHCLHACADASAEIAAFNRDRERDYQIRMGCGVAAGTSLVVADIIVGDAWELCEQAGENVAGPGEVVFTGAVHCAIADAPGLCRALLPHVVPSGAPQLLKIADCALLCEAFAAQQPQRQQESLPGEKEGVTD